MKGISKVYFEWLIFPINHSERLLHCNQIIVINGVLVINFISLEDHALLNLLFEII